MISHKTRIVRFCCLSVAVCGAVTAGCVCMYCAHCTCLHVCGTWDRHTNRVRTIDRVRVHGFKWLKWLVK